LTAVVGYETLLPEKLAFFKEDGLGLEILEEHNHLVVLPYLLPLLFGYYNPPTIIYCGLLSLK
jgi:hypothetical protein